MEKQRGEGKKAIKYDSDGVISICVQSKQTYSKLKLFARLLDAFSMTDAWNHTIYTTFAQLNILGTNTRTPV